MKTALAKRCSPSVWLALHDEKRAWKGFYWDVPGRRHAEGPVEGPVVRIESLVLANEGLRRYEAWSGSCSCGLPNMSVTAFAGHRLEGRCDWAGPKQQFVETQLLITDDDSGGEVGKVSSKLDADTLAGLDLKADHRAVFAPAARTSKLCAICYLNS